jgi:phosphate transport system substrate-binding protein
MARAVVRIHLALILLLMAGCSGAAVATPRPALITIAGATAMHPVLQALTEEYTRRHPNVLFTVRGGGSTLGEEQAAAGRVELGATTRFPPEPGQADALDLTRTPVGIDGLALVVHSTNPVESLTLDQLQQIFNGEILDWSEVGGDEGAIELVSREDGSGSRELFESRVMRGDAVALTAVVMPTSGDVVEYVGKTPLAIGYVSRGYAPPPDAAPAATPEPARVRVVAVEGQLPTLDALRSQEYALIQPLYLVSRGEPRGAVRQFLDFVLSPAGQAIVARYHLPAR